MANKILSAECMDAMLASSKQMAKDIGIQTNRQDLLDKIRNSDGLKIKGNRIFVHEKVFQEVVNILRRPKKNPSLPPLNPTITVPGRPTLIADYRTRKLRPLTRQDVIKGTKLIHALCFRNVKGHTCGTPQDSILPLQPIEQYIIGFRYNQSGGQTSVPSTKENAGFLNEIREIAENFNARERKFRVWLPSPLRLEGNELDELLDSDAKVTGVFCGSMPIMGLTGPVDPVGIYTLSTAETLGSLAILHRIYPGASLGFNPHPQPMDVRSGLISFGTLEWNRLCLIKKELYEHLEIPYDGNKENLTSSCMPDAQAQADKMASIAFAVANGFTNFNLFPLCADEGWSCEQLVLDVEYVHTAWQILKSFGNQERASDAFKTVAASIQQNTIIGEMEDTVTNLRENYFALPLPRLFSSNQWIEAGGPDLVQAAEAYANDLVQKSDYHPPEDKWKKVIEIYHKACKHFQVDPMKFE